MKESTWRWCLVAGIAGFTLVGSARAVCAAEEDRGAQGERLDRLEQRLNEMAQRQEQMMHQFGASPQRQGPMPPPGLDPMRRPLSPAGSMAPERAKLLRDISGVVKLMVLGGILFNILLAVWIYTDIRKRGEGSGIFIALALVAGIPAAIIYALVRISDKKT